MGGGCFCGLFGGGSREAEDARRREILDRLLEDYSTQLMHKLTRRMRTLELDICDRKRMLRQAQQQQQQMALTSSKDIESLHLKVFELEASRRRRSLQVEGLRRTLTKVRTIFLAQSNDPEGDVNLEASQMQAEIRAERERWSVERRILQEEIKSVAAEIRWLNEEVENEDEIKHLKRNVHQLQMSIENKDRYACWVCNDPNKIRTVWDDEDQDAMCRSDSIGADTSAMDGADCCTREIDFLEAKIKELRRELAQSSSGARRGSSTSADADDEGCRSVRFARGRNESEVPAAVVGSLKPLRGRVPTGYPRESGPAGLTLYFENGRRSEIDGAAFVRDLQAVFRERGLTEQSLSQLHASLHPGSLIASIRGKPSAVADLRSVLVDNPEVVVSGFVGRLVEDPELHDGTATTSSITFATENLEISPTEDRTAGNMELRSSRGRVPTAFEAATPKDGRLIRFADADTIETPKNCTSELSIPLQGSSYRSVLHRSPSKNSSASRASSSSVQSSYSEDLDEDASERDGSERPARGRASTPHLSKAALGFLTGTSDKTSESSNSVSNSSFVGKKIPSSTSSKGSRLEAKKTSVESLSEREISARVRRSAMQRQERTDRNVRGSQKLDNLTVERVASDRARRLERRTSDVEERDDNPELNITERLVEDHTKDVDLLMNAIGEIDIFDNLDREEREELIGAFELYHYKDGDIAVRQGDTEGTHFFIIAIGTFEVVKDGVSRVKLGRGAYFGEMALILFGERSATVRAVGSATAYAADGMELHDLLRDIFEKKYASRMVAVDEVLEAAGAGTGGDVEMLSMLNSYQLQSLYDEADLATFMPGEKLLGIGDPAVECIHVLLSGTVMIESPGIAPQTLRRLGLVGDRAIVIDKITRNYVAHDEARTLVLSRGLLDKLFGDQLSLMLMRNRILGILCNHEVFGRLHEEQREAVAQCCQILPLAEAEDMEHDDDICFVAVLFGEVETDHLVVETGGGSPISDAESPSGYVFTRRYYGAKNDSFGKEYLSARSAPWGIRVKACSDSRLAVWKSQSLNEVLNFDDLDRALEQEDKMRVLRSIFVFRTLSRPQLRQLAGALGSVKKDAGETIVRQGDIGEEFYIIRSGVVTVKVGDRVVRNQSVLDWFGERALLYDEPRTATVLAEEDCELWIINKTTFTQEIKGATKEYLTSRISLQDTCVSFDELQFLRVVGRGGFGVVKMVKSSKTNVRYALKCVSKRLAVEKCAQKTLVAEHSILAELDHPFIIKFVRTFNTSTNVYFLQELVSGGELLDILYILNILNHGQAQFYTGSLILALEYLHAKKIAYLDLKSENVLVDHQGYLKMIDFGMAQKITSRGRASGRTGTFEFAAPEMILLEGYSTSADLWSLGICVYEFVIGHLPFYNNCKTFSEKVEEVKNLKLQFPSSFAKGHSKETRSLISGLLCRNPAKRLGASGYGALKEHLFFKGFSWDDLIDRKLEPPLVPKGESYSEDAQGAKAEIHEEGQPLKSVAAMEEEEAAKNGHWEDPDPRWAVDF